MNKSALQDIQQSLNAIRGEIERVDDETKWAALELMLGTSSSVVALAKKMAKPETKTVTRTVANGQYFERLRDISKPKSDDEHIFTVDNENELSKRTLRFKRVKPSVGTLAICASKLQHYGRCMTATEQHTQLGKRLLNSVNNATSRLTVTLWGGGKTR